MITTLVGFLLFFGAPIAYHEFKFHPLVCFIAFFWGIHILIG